VYLWLWGFSLFFGGDHVLVWGFFFEFLCLCRGFVRFSVVKLNGIGLWVLEKSGEFRVVFVGIS